MILNASRTFHPRGVHLLAIRSLLICDLLKGFGFQVCLDLREWSILDRNKVKMQSFMIEPPLDVVNFRSTVTGQNQAVDISKECICPRAVPRAIALGTARGWDATTGEDLLTLPVDSAGTGGVSFSPDGKQLAVGAYSGIYLFALPIDDVIALAKSRLIRSFTTEECKQYLHLQNCPPEL